MNSPILALVLIVAGGVLLWRYKTCPSGPRRVACLGDSITAGNYALTLGRLLAPQGGSAKAFGYPGLEVNAVRARGWEAVQAWGPTDVVVLAGVNNLYNSKGAPATAAALQALYDLVKKANYRLVAVQLTPWSTYADNGWKWQADTRMLNDWIANSNADRVVDTDSLGDERRALLPYLDSGDHLHPSVKGQAMLGQLIYNQAFRCWP